MTKSQFVNSLASTLPNLQKGDVELTVETVFNCMAGALARGDRIEIRGIGTFSVKTRDAREGRNPKTGEKASVPRRNTLHFTPGKELRTRVDRGRL